MDDLVISINVKDVYDVYLSTLESYKSNRLHFNTSTKNIKARKRLGSISYYKIIEDNNIQYAKNDLEYFSDFKKDVELLTKHLASESKILIYEAYISTAYSVYMGYIFFNKKVIFYKPEERISINNKYKFKKKPLWISKTENINFETDNVNIYIEETFEIKLNKSGFILTKESYRKKELLPKNAISSKTEMKEFIEKLKLIVDELNKYNFKNINIFCAGSPHVSFLVGRVLSKCSGTRGKKFIVWNYDFNIKDYDFTIEWSYNDRDLKMETLKI